MARRIRKVTICLTEDEKARLESKAAAAGLELAPYLRALGLRGGIERPHRRRREIHETQGFLDTHVGFRISSAAKERLLHYADMCGMTLGTYLRTIAAGVVPNARPRYAENVLLVELTRIGTNINQIARRLNVAARTAHRSHAPTLHEVSEAVERTHECVTETLMTFLGATSERSAEDSEIEPW